MKIVVIGSGYVGTTAAGIFALSGHSVTAIDIDSKKVDIINGGKAPFYEDGLNSIISEGIARGSLTATTDYSSCISGADVVFSCVGTPDHPDGSSNLQYVFDAAKEAAKYLKEGAVYVQKSTVPVGTGRKVIELLPNYVTYVSNPEFLREGTAIFDTLFFDRVVAGGDNVEANNTVLSIHKSVEGAASDIANVSKIQIDEEKLKNHSGDYISTHLESAELIKVTANAFLSLKISFANSIAKLCDVTGADITEVMDVVGSDNRIGRAFFNAGRGYGGGCFPKDVSGLISSALEHGVDMPIMTAATDINASMPGYIIRRSEALVDNFRDKNVTVLGLAFKANTSDSRKSPAIAIANELAQLGARVRAYDPEAKEEAAHTLDTSITVTDSMNSALDGAEVVFIATDWKEFTSVPNWKSVAPSATTIVDCMNCISIESTKDMQYLGVGRTI